MNKKVFTDLQLEDVLRKISSYSLSLRGAELVVSSSPITDRDEYLKRQEEVSQIISAIIMSASSDISLENIPDVSFINETLNKSENRIFNGTELYDLAYFIKTSFIFKDYLMLSNSEVGQSITSLSEELRALSNKIFEIIDISGQVKESVPSLKRLRDKIQIYKQKRTDYARSFIKSNLDHLTSDNAVLRNGRMVLPVKYTSKNVIKGYAQSYSNSLNTVFMEDFKLLDLNNDIALSEQEISNEISRLLSELTSGVKTHISDISSLFQQITNADFLYSFAIWAYENKCCKVLPEMEDYTCSLINAKHPLVKNCVPISLDVKSKTKAVVISGPNAGGKTITLKTVGLLALLNQICGFIPADEGSFIRLFDNVFSDIGDEQSIYNNLSTFSAHMKNISFILNKETPSSLVLLDEPGSSTDPVEGSALASGILDYSSERAALTLVASHYDNLKKIAFGNDSYENASMEFDTETLKPKFKINIGLPGDSYAIQTAKKMNIPFKVLELSKSYMGNNSVKISSIIQSLTKLKQLKEEEEREIKNRLTQLKKDQDDLLKLRLELLEEKRIVKTQELNNFSSFLHESRSKIENLIKELKEEELNSKQKSKAKEEMASISNIKKDLAEELKSIEDEIIESKDLINISSGDYKVGMSVLCGKNKREGIITSVLKGNRYQVAIGQIKFTFHKSDIYPTANVMSKRAIYQVEGYVKNLKPKITLDVRGMYLDQAIDSISTEIEACRAAGIKNFSIIHGLGEGKLYAGIHDYLSTLNYVKDYAFGHPDNEGHGKTYVTLI